MRFFCLRSVSVRSLKVVFDLLESGVGSDGVVFGFSWQLFGDVDLI